MIGKLYEAYAEALANFWTVHGRLVSEGVTDIRSNPDYENADILANDAYSKWLKAAIARDKAALAD